MITATLAAMLLVPILYTMLKERALRRGTLPPQDPKLDE